jgi:ribosomal protein L37E
MEQRTYRGDLVPEGLADALVTRFNSGPLMAQKVGDDEHTLVQIATRHWQGRGAQVAMSVGIAKIDGGIEVTLGQQQWLGPAMELLDVGLKALFRPLALLGEVDDIASSISSLTLPSQIWEAVEHYIESVGANLGLAERQHLVKCPYCGVGNPVGVGQCSACGAGLSDVQPIYCSECGKLANPNAKYCDRCGFPLKDTRPTSE